MSTLSPERGYGFELPSKLYMLDSYSIGSIILKVPHELVLFLFMSWYCCRCARRMLGTNRYVSRV